MFKKVLFVIVTALITVSIVGCKKGASEQGQAAQTPPPPSVTVGNVSYMDVQLSDSFVGKVEAAIRTNIRARTSGFLSSIAVKEGDSVKRAQLLFKLEQDQYIAALRKAEADLTTAQANYENAKVQRERGVVLLGDESISQARFDDINAAFKIAQAVFKQAQVAVDNAKLNLSYTNIISPIDGTIGLIPFTEGELVGPESGIIGTVIGQSPMYVTFAITDREYQLLLAKYGSDMIYTGKGDQKVSLEILFADGSKFPEKGVLNFRDNNVDMASNSIRMRGEFQNKNGALSHGQSVNVKIVGNMARKMLVIPNAAIMSDVGGKYVFVVDQDQNFAMRRIVVGGLVDAKTVIVVDGLKENETIMLGGMNKVRPGQKITPVPAGGVQNGGQPMGAPADKNVGGGK